MFVPHFFFQDAPGGDSPLWKTRSRSVQNAAVLNSFFASLEFVKDRRSERVFQRGLSPPGAVLRESIKIIYTIKIKYGRNQTLDQKVVIFILNRIMLPLIGFKTSVLIESPLGKHIKLNGGILMGIQRNLWVAMLIYTISTWGLAFVIIWITYN